MDNRGIAQINFDCFTIDESSQVKVFSEIMRCQGYFFSKKKCSGDEFGKYIYVQ